MTPATEPHLVPLEAFGTLIDPLYPAAEVPMPSVCRYTNIAPTSPHGARRAAFAARTGRPRAIGLYRLPADAIVHGTAQFAVTLGDTFLSDQLLPQHHQGRDKTLARLRAIAPEELPGETLLVARYGYRTWGHWLGELLPKIVLAEQHYPGRFRYVVVNSALNPRAGGLFAQRAQESLDAYGVTPERLVMVREDRAYRSSSLYTLSAVWTDYMMHPAARAALRRLETPLGAHRRVALLRGDNARRDLVNLPDILPLLEAAGFTRLDIALLPFRDQVATMRGADTVFSILGSSLSGLIYAPEAVNVISAAPEGFSDRFFYSMMQLAGARYAELAGPIAARDEKHLRDSSFSLPAPALTEALGVLGLGPPLKSGLPSAAEGQTTASSSFKGVFVVGTKQMRDLTQALAGDDRPSITRCNVVRAARGLPLQHSVFAHYALAGVPPTAVPAFHALGYSDDDLQGYFGPAREWPGGIWLLSFWHETARTLYRHRASGALIPVAFPQETTRAMISALGPQAGADATLWGEAPSVDPDLLRLLRQEFIFVGETPRDVLHRNIHAIVGAAPPGARVIALLANEQLHRPDGTTAPARQAVRINAVVRAAVKTLPRVELLDVAACAESPDELSPTEAFTLTPAIKQRIAARILASVEKAVTA